MNKKIIAITLLAMLSILTLSAGAEKEAIETKETYIFIDSLSREVSTPLAPDKISPSGNVAQMALYALAPETLSGWSSKISSEDRKLFFREAVDLPVFGTFYGKKANLNKEALLASGTELIIDVGEIKGSREAMAAELDALSEELGIPIIFIEAYLEDYPDLFRTLGKLTGEKDKAEALALYAEEALSYGRSLKENIESPMRVYYSISDDGLEAVETGSFHGEVIEYIGCENVVPSTFSSSNGIVSLEQIYLWDPEAIILTSEEAYKTVTENELWSTLDAVQNDRVYLMPSAPYPLLDMPPATQRLFGIYWLAAAVYPEYAPEDYMKKATDYYSLFYNTELTEAEIIKYLGL